MQRLNEKDWPHQLVAGKWWPLVSWTSMLCTSMPFPGADRAKFTDTEEYGSLVNQRECKRIVNLKPRGAAETRTVNNPLMTFLASRSSSVFTCQCYVEIIGHITKARSPIQRSSLLKSLNGHARHHRGREWPQFRVLLPDMTQPPSPWVAMALPFLPSHFPWSTDKSRNWGELNVVTRVGIVFCSLSCWWDRADRETYVRNCGRGSSQTCLVSRSAIEKKRHRVSSSP